MNKSLEILMAMPLLILDLAVLSSCSGGRLKYRCSSNFLGKQDFLDYKGGILLDRN